MSREQSSVAPEGDGFDGGGDLPLVLETNLSTAHLVQLCFLYLNIFVRGKMNKEDRISSQKNQSF